ncbi:MAG: signal peptidase I [Planctomycetota bacterium]
MSRESRRQPFETASRRDRTAAGSGATGAAGRGSTGGVAASGTLRPAGPIQGFFTDYGTRETIESILVAVVLALLFRTFQAEAFIIPTGSMAPTLMGQHIDVACDKCRYQYRTGATEENTTRPVAERDPITRTFCPLCQYPMRLRRNKDADHRSNQGDRILVNKFVYDFQPPERFDVIVFKYPNNGKQNYIKRLVGLPGENLVIQCGDIFSLTPKAEGAGWNWEIVRKPPEKLLTMLQLVDDTHFVAAELRKVNWPWRWQQWGVEDSERGWTVVESGGKPLYQVTAESAKTPQWLRYRHMLPTQEDWELISEGRQVARLQNDLGRWIGDYYAYNDSEVNNSRRNKSWGANFVGDIGLEAVVDIQEKSGQLLLDLVEGGAHFHCTVDIASGKATLSCADSSVRFRSASGEPIEEPTAETSIRGPGRYLVKYVNADDQLRLWVNGKLVEFTTDLYTREGRVFPTWSPNDAGDAEPLGIGSAGAALKVERIQVWRDIYYISVTQREQTFDEGIVPPPELLAISREPKSWGSSRVRSAMAGRYRPDKPMFQLGEGQYMPMGDNSPASLDARVWPGAPYVEEALLLGRALFIYWPHSLNKPIPFFPNFPRMGPIR